jgi:hypothetical protein
MRVAELRSRVTDGRQRAQRYAGVSTLVPSNGGGDAWLCLHAGAAPRSTAPPSGRRLRHSGASAAYELSRAMPRSVEL